MRNATTLSMVAVAIVAILVAAIAATTVNGVNSAYAWSNSQQTKIVVLNKCANLDDENKHNTVKDVKCDNDRFRISVDK
jgi:FlaG/FlaF family flagellin (archaellin)